MYSSERITFNFILSTFLTRLCYFVTLLWPEYSVLTDISRWWLEWQTATGTVGGQFTVSLYIGVDNTRSHQEMLIILSHKTQNITKEDKSFEFFAADRKRGFCRISFYPAMCCSLQQPTTLTVLPVYTTKFNCDPLRKKPLVLFKHSHLTVDILDVGVGGNREGRPLVGKK